MIAKWGPWGDGRLRPIELVPRGFRSFLIFSPLLPAFIFSISGLLAPEKSPQLIAIIEFQSSVFVADKQSDVPNSESETRPQSTG